MTQNGSSRVETLILEFLGLIKRLSTFSSFEPSPALDDVLGRISHTCHQNEVSPAEEDEVSG